MAVGRVLILSGALSRAVVKTFTGEELKWIHREGNVPMGAASQASARFRGNSNYKDYGIRWLLLRAVEAVGRTKGLGCD